jgi:hypothetical protein
MPSSQIAAWLLRVLPESWFVAPPELLVDREEIIVVGRIPEPADAVGEARAARCESAIGRFRRETRDDRVSIARAAERQFGRPLSWGAECGEVRVLFTALTVPAMTRLRMSERRVLDTLIAAGVARSRSEALAWCVRLVGANEATWLADLRDAFAHVERVRTAGPKAPDQ